MTAARRWNIGDQAAVVVTFTNAAGTATTPTTVTAWYRRPGQAATATSTVNEATGVEVLTLPPFDTPATWYWGVKGVGAVVAAVEGSFHVTTSKES